MTRSDGMTGADKPASADGPARALTPERGAPYSRPFEEGTYIVDDPAGTGLRLRR